VIGQYSIFEQEARRILEAPLQFAPPSTTATPPLIEWLTGQQIQAPLLHAPPSFPVEEQAEITGARITYQLPAGDWLDWLKQNQVWVFAAAAGLFLVAISSRRR